MKGIPVITRWYVLYIRHNFVQRAAKEINELSFDCFLPTRKIYKKWSDRIKRIEEPLFPSYLFIKTSLKDAARFLQLEGVIRYVSCDGKPAPVQDWEMDRLIKLVNSNEPLVVEPYLSVGDSVEVTDGPFIGLEGILVRKAGQSRLMVRLPILKQAISVELPETYLKLSNKTQLV